MAEYEESIYGNQEIIRKHEGGSRPTKVIRPDGLGQESPVNFQEGGVYANCQTVQGKLYPVLKKGEETSRPMIDDHYEVFDHQNKGTSRTSGFANRNQKKVYEENVDKVSRSKQIRQTDREPTIETIELQEKEPQDSVNVIPPEIIEKRKSKEVSSSCLAAIAIFLSLVAFTVALLFGFKVIEGADKCDCQEVRIGLQAQIDYLKQEVHGLRMNFSQLSSKSVSYMPSTSSTAIPHGQMESTSVTSTSIATSYTSIATSSTIASKGITATPSRNFATLSFSTASSVSNSSAIIHTTSVI